MAPAAGSTEFSHILRLKLESPLILRSTRVTGAGAPSAATAWRLFALPDWLRTKGEAVSVHSGSLMFSLVLAAGLAGTASVAELASHARQLPVQSGAELRPPSAFSSIADPQARSASLFLEAAKVIMDPRCVNCHPAGDHPLQGDDGHIHFPAAVRGEAGVGVPGGYCATCHAERNVIPLAAPRTSIPGHPRWQLAPREMAWEGRTPAQICQQLKDKERNGGRTLGELHEHMAHDDLVGWAWDPGIGRRSAPGTQGQFGELVAAWIQTGAACP
jgi:hypothetical protein